MTILRSIAPVTAALHDHVAAGIEPASEPKLPALRLSSGSYKRIERLLNQTIHELVFVCALLNDDQLEISQECMTAAWLNFESASQLISKSLNKKQTP